MVVYTYCSFLTDLSLPNPNTNVKITFWISHWPIIYVLQPKNRTLRVAPQVYKNFCWSKSLCSESLWLYSVTLITCSRVETSPVCSNLESKPELELSSCKAPKSKECIFYPYNYGWSTLTMSLIYSGISMLRVVSRSTETKCHYTNYYTYNKK